MKKIPRGILRSFGTGKPETKNLKPETRNQKPKTVEDPERNDSGKPKT